jgi:hypothetical protein
MKYIGNEISNVNTQKMINALDNAISVLEKKYKASNTEDICELLNLMYQLIEV